MATGRTLGEVRLMPLSELGTWMAYVEENGPLNPMLRLESAVARAVLPFVRKAKMRDFMPWPREPEREPTQEEMAEGLLRMFQSAAAHTNKSRH